MASKSFLSSIVRSNAEGAFLITIRQANSDEHVAGRYQPEFDAFQLATVFAVGERRSKDRCQKVVGHVRICCKQKHFFFSEQYRRSSMPRSVATVYLQVFYKPPRRHPPGAANKLLLTQNASWFGCINMK
jgi:hypothetical protein